MRFSSECAFISWSTFSLPQEGILSMGTNIQLGACLIFSAISPLFSLSPLFLDWAFDAPIEGTLVENPLHIQDCHYPSPIGHRFHVHSTRAIADIARFARQGAYACGFKHRRVLLSSTEDCVIFDWFFLLEFDLGSLGLFCMAATDLFEPDEGMGGNDWTHWCNKMLQMLYKP